MKGFTAPQVCEFACISYRQLDFWTRSGYLKATAEATKGTGYPRKYGTSDVVKARAMYLLASAGIPPATASRILKDHHVKTTCEWREGRAVLTVDVAGIRKDVAEWVAS